MTEHVETFPAITPSRPAPLTPAGTHPRFTSRLFKLASRCAQVLSRYERSLLAVTLLVFALAAVQNALTHPIWYDEFLTLFIARLSSFREMLLAMPADSQPPMQYLFTHLSLSLFGQNEFALRLPEMLAYLVAAMLVYRIVRRHGSALQALFAVIALLSCKTNAVQAYTARPYGLLVCFTALAFCSWQSASLRPDRRFIPLLGITLGVAGAILTHHTGILNLGLFLIAGEAAKLWQRRRIDIPVLAAIAAGLSPLILTAPLAKKTQQLLGDPMIHSHTFWARPSLFMLAFYLWMAPVLFLFILAACALLMRRRDPASVPAISPSSIPLYEWAAAGALILALPMQVLVASFEHGYFFPRHAVDASLGIAIVFAFALPRIGRLRSVAEPVLALSTPAYLLILIVSLCMRQADVPAGRVAPSAAAVSPLLLHAPGNLPIVVANADEFPTDWWYAPPALKARLTYLYDVSFAVKQSDFVPELCLAADQPYFPLPISGFSPFTGRHAHFLLLYSGLARLNLAAMHLDRSTWQLTPIAQSGTDVLYRVDRNEPSRLDN